jgi:2-polyprenyl-6-methoxyphenol hydroxylase-like FAD-dependent oxidoreductase
MHNNTIEEEEDKAIVIGGGIAGLLAARVLSGHFSKTIVIEKDRYPKEKGPRNGTPQANHIHVFLVKGMQTIIDLFPGIEEKLLSQGGHKIDVISKAKFKFPTGWARNFNSDMNTIVCSRQLLEYTIRQEILEKYFNVKIVENARAIGLATDSEQKIITGVNVIYGNGNNNNDINKTTIINANLVVDASGRRSETPIWFEKIGLEKPNETKINSFIGYAGRRIQLLSTQSSPLLSNHKVVVVFTNPPNNPRMVVMTAIEDNQWQLGLLGIGKTYPPTDEKGFLNFVKELGVEDVYKIVRDAKPISNIYGYREDGSRLYHYEKIKKWPKNFIVLGDAVSAFNPIYAQGVTVAAIQSKILDNLLREYKINNAEAALKKGFEKKFQGEIAKLNSLPWLLGTSEDLRWSTTEANKKMNPFTKIIQRYSKHVILLTPNSRLATKSFLEMLNMVKSPAVLFHPLLIVQVLAQVIKSKVERTARCLQS